MLRSPSHGLLDMKSGPATTPESAAPPAGPQPPADPLRAFSAADTLAAYRAGDHDGVARRFLTVLDHLSVHTYAAPDGPTQHALDDFARHFLHLMSQEDFVPSDGLLAALLGKNPVIANLASMTAFGTTDAYVRILLGQPRNFMKLLALFSPRNRAVIDSERLFAAHPALASRWYFLYPGNYSVDSVRAESHARLVRHIAEPDARLAGDILLCHHLFFAATYVDPQGDRVVKRRINELVQSTPLCRRQIRNAPRRGRIAVITATWWPQQSVYRSQAPFIEALARDHELVLVHLGRPRDDLDTRFFSEVRRYDAARADDLSAVDPNDFALAYFPDVGMNLESVLLANMRIAPAQAACYGHPASTHGARIDFWIGGRDAEDPDPERAQARYSERLVLIPGCGQASVPIDYRPVHPLLPAEPVVIDCPWAGQKIRHDHLARLAEIARRARTPVRFRFFPGGTTIENRLVPLRLAIEEALGRERVEVFGPLAYAAYLRELEAGHVAFDSHPFGGYNTAVDLLWLRKPILTLEGDRFFNRATAHLLRRVGLDELVTRTGDAFVETGVRLVDDAAFRARMVRRLRIADVPGLILGHEHVPAFVAAIEGILDGNRSS